MVKRPNPKRRQRPGTDVIKHAAAVRRADAPAVVVLQPIGQALPHHSSMKGQLSHAAKEMLSMGIALAELAAIFGISWLAGQYADYLKKHQMPAWKVMVFEGIDDGVLVVDAILFVVYFGKRTFLSLKMEFK